MKEKYIFRIQLPKENEKIRNKVSEALLSAFEEEEGKIIYSLEEDGFFQYVINNSKKFLKYSEIQYFEKIKHRIKIKTANDSIYYYGSFSSLEKELDSSQFLRVHQGYIVNTSNIRKYENMKLYLRPDNCTVPVSRRRQKDVIEMMNEISWLMRLFRE